MRRLALAIPVLCFIGLAQAQTAAGCAAVVAPEPLPVLATLVAPVAPELVAPRHQLGAPGGVLSHAFDESQSLEQVLFRMKAHECQSFAMAAPAAMPGAIPAATDPAAYQPKTEFDNTPWRFDMNQNGKRMTADEFSAWMAAKGVRVAKGAAVVVPVVDAVAVPAQAAAPAPADGQTSPPQDDVSQQ